MNRGSTATNDLVEQGAGTAAAPFPWRLAWHLALVATGYYVAVRLGLAFRFGHSQIAVVWPANAVLLSALILSPRRHWWIVLAVVAVAHVAAMAPSVPAWRMLWQLAANYALAIATTEMLRRFAGLPLLFSTRRQVVAYAAILSLLPILFALITASFVRSLLNLETPNRPAQILLATILTNAVAVFLVAPPILLWARVTPRQVFQMSRRRLTEAAAVFATVLLVGLIAFGAPAEYAHLPWLLLAIFPPLLWAAVRFGPLGASTAALCVAALSILGTAHHLGPFVASTNTNTMLSMQIFWIVLCLPVMLLAAVIREREQAEQALRDLRNQLAHALRVATAHHLSSTLAHELSQPLAAIRLNAEAGSLLLARQPADVAQVSRILEDIVADDDYAASVVTRFRSFIKTGDPKFHPVALDTVVRNALALFHGTEQRFHVNVETDVAAGLPDVRGDGVQLTQVVLNLLINGCESMGEVSAADRRLHIGVTRVGEGSLEVQVADHGVGLPPDESRVFEPFFTTKEGGLGLGLAISRFIVDAHGGRLFATRNPAGGATFHVVLPADAVSR